MFVREIYDYNVGSQRVFESVGFEKYEKTNKGYSYRLQLGGKEMDITIKEISDELFLPTVRMITDLMNYHRKLNNAPKEYWQTDEQSKGTLMYWKEKGTIYNIFLEDVPIGFFYVRFGGQNASWLEDIFIIEEYRGRDIGKVALKKLDELMEAKRVVAMFVDVIPRNEGAIKLYRECGFDHLNIIQLRKNYDKRLDKQEEVEILGFKFKKY